MGGKDFKKFNALRKEKEQLAKERAREEKERIADLKDKLGDKLVKYPNPVPAAYRTFDSWNLHYKKNKPNPRGPKGPGFGKGERFGLDEQAKYSKEVKLYNEGNPDGKELDPKANPVPGPGYYKLQEVWPGKELKMRRAYSAKPKQGDRIMKHISKGPTTSIYYQK